MVFSLAIVEQTELQESSTVVVAQPRGRRQILDGLLRVAHSYVTLCAEFPRFRIPRGNLQAHQLSLARPPLHSVTLTEETLKRTSIALPSNSMVAL